MAWPILPDDPARIAAALRDAAAAFDLVLTCGGVSADQRWLDLAVAVFPGVGILRASAAGRAQPSLASSSDQTFVRP